MADLALAPSRPTRAPDPRGIAQGWLDAFLAAVAHDPEQVRALFLAEGYWRDLLALTWDYRTFAGPAGIAAGLKAALGKRVLHVLRLADGKEPELLDRRRGRTIEAFLTLETDIGVGRGHVRLIETDGAWKAWTLVTTMEDLTGHEERVGSRRPWGSHGDPDRQHSPVATGLGTKDDPAVLVIGAGQAGLTVAARLKQLDVSALVIDREERVGDNWRNRYSSLLLHNQVWGNHFPYLPFPSSWPVYLSKADIADWLEAYASILRLDVRTTTELVEASFDEAAGHWTVRLRGPGGVVTTLRPRHIVQATGVFGTPNRPDIAGASGFDGEIIHAVDYAGGERLEDKRVLVLGAGSSAHDIAQDLVEAGAEVTMLQRSTTCILSLEPGAARAYAVYSENGPPIEDADLITNSYPFPVVTELHKDLTRKIAHLDRDLLDGLRRAGFGLDFGEDESGFLMKYHRYGGGYYINVGASDLIVEGRIKVKHGVEIDRLAGRTVTFTDGTSLGADVVVVAAGYKSMSASIRALMGDDVADNVGPVWGLGPDGEVRAMWRRTGQPGFWLMGGSLQQCRPYSKYLALQIKAAELGLI